jgi:mitochondrial fission protein ELM1
MAHVLIVWRFVDGKPGHEKQTQALIEGLHRYANISVHTIDVTRNAVERICDRVLKNPVKHTTNLPSPDLIIGAGHRTHLPMLTARASRGGKVVVLMKPSLPLDWFDLVIAPAHDQLGSRYNLLTSSTVLAPGLECEPDLGRGLILVGGHNKHFHWSSPQLSCSIDQIVEQYPDVNWQLTTSRRTPADFFVTPRKNLVSHDCKALPSDWLAREMAMAGYVCVTVDSASMVAESLNSKAKTIVLPMRTKHKNNKLQVSIERLAEFGYLDLWQTKQGSNKNSLAGSMKSLPLNEHLHCAWQLLDYFYSDVADQGVQPLVAA